MLDRVGKQMDHKDMNAFRMEWQVKPDQGDPLLFSTIEGPQWPESCCVMPQWVDPKKKRRGKMATSSVVMVVVRTMTMRRTSVVLLSWPALVRLTMLFV